MYNFILLIISLTLSGFMFFYFLSKILEERRRERERKAQGKFYEPLECSTVKCCCWKNDSNIPLIV